MKKRLIFSLLIALCMEACGSVPAAKTEKYENGDNRLEAEAQYLDLSFEEMVSFCTDVLIGTYSGINDIPGNRGLSFKVENVLFGNYEGREITAVLNGGLMESDNFTYETGKKYLLLLERNSSVFTDYDTYVFAGDAYIPMEHISLGLMADKKLAELWPEAEDEEANALVTYILDHCKNSEAYGVPYIVSDDREEILAAAPYILKLEIVDVFLDVEDRISYTTKLTECLKGETKLSEIILVLPKNDRLDALKTGSVIVAAVQMDPEGNLAIPEAYNAWWTSDEAEEFLVTEIK